MERRQLLSGIPADAQQLQLAYDGGGTLHLAYYDSTEHDLKYASRSPAGVWSATVVVDHSSTDAGGELSLAIDPSGNPGIAYDDTAGQRLLYAHLSGSTWSTSVIDSRNTDPRPDLTFDIAGRALVSFFHPKGGTVRLAQFDGHRWRTRVLANVHSTDHAGTSLAVNPANGTVTVGFQSAKGVVQVAAEVPAQKGRGPAAISARFRTGSVQALAQGDADPVVLFDPSGQLAVGYYDLAHDQVVLSRAAGGGWQATAVAPSDAHQVGPEVLFDPWGEARVVFANSAGVFVAAAVGGTFQISALAAGGTAAAVLEPGTGTIVTASSGTGDGVQTTSSLPAASGLTAAAATANQISLTWTDNSAGTAGYAIERSTDGQNFSEVARVPAGVTQFADTSLAPATQYTYRVRTLDNGGNVAYSDTADATTLRAAPTGFFADAAFTDDPASMIRLQWDAGDATVTGFRIQRSTDGVNFADVATVTAGVTQYLDTGLPEDVRYTYRLMSLAADGLSDSAVAVNAEPTWLATPTSLVATAPSASQIDLTWTNNSVRATGYRILVSADGVGFLPLANVTDTSGKYAVTADAVGNPIAAGHTYYFRVIATNDDDASNYSDVAAVTMVNSA